MAIALDDVEGKHMETGLLIPQVLVSWDHSSRCSGGNASLRLTGLRTHHPIFRPTVDVWYIHTRWRRKRTFPLTQSEQQFDQSHAVVDVVGASRLVNPLAWMEIGGAYMVSTTYVLLGITTILAFASVRPVLGDVERAEPNRDAEGAEASRNVPHGQLNV